MCILLKSCVKYHYCTKEGVYFLYLTKTIGVKNILIVVSIDRLVRFSNAIKTVFPDT